MLKTTVPTTGLDAIRPYQEDLKEVFLTRANTLNRIINSVLTHPGQNPAHLSLSSGVTYPTFYQALRETLVDERELVNSALGLGDKLELDHVYALDLTNVERPQARTSPSRVKLHTGGPAGRGHQTRWGWKLLQCNRLGPEYSSWQTPLTTRHFPPGKDLNEETVSVAELLPPGSTLLLDAGFPAARVTKEVKGKELDLTLLVRLSKSQVFYTRAETYRGSGRPRLHGEKLHPVTSEIPPDAEVSYPDEFYGEVTIKRWDRVHPKNPTLGVVEGYVYHVKVGRVRKSRDSVLVIWSNRPLPLSGVFHTYMRRFQIEHYFRFMKQRLGLGSYHPVEPGSTVTWARVLGISFNHLHAVRKVVGWRKLPWEKERKHLSPGQVLREFTHLDAFMPVAPEARKLVGGTGWEPGKHRRRRKRHRVVTKKKR